MTLILLIALAVCGFFAIRATRLLQSAVWLAVASALTSIILYQQGATQAAVIELSVGAGLVFILFVFAINLAPSPEAGGGTGVPALVAFTFVGLAMVLLAELAWPRSTAAAAAAAAPLSVVLWQDRLLDLVVQVVLLFSGALTVAGLLAAESRTAAASLRVSRPFPAAPPAARPQPLAAAQQKEKAA